MKTESQALLQQVLDLANGNKLDADTEGLIKGNFRKILEMGDTYDINEIEGLFSRGNGSVGKETIDRVLNIAHYQKSKFDASNKFRMVSSDGCDCGHC